MRRLGGWVVEWVRARLTIVHVRALLEVGQLGGHVDCGPYTCLQAYPSLCIAVVYGCPLQVAGTDPEGHGISAERCLIRPPNAALTHTSPQRPPNAYVFQRRPCILTWHVHSPGGGLSAVSLAVPHTAHIVPDAPLSDVALSFAVTQSSRYHALTATHTHTMVKMGYSPGGGLTTVSLVVPHTAYV